jgi:hypothetical protein
VTDAGRTMSIAEVLVSEEVLRIQDEEWSGVLALTQEDVAKGIYFLDGDIAFAASTLEEDRLGANLVRIGRISGHEFQTAMLAAQEPGRHFGQALIAAGVLSPTELAAAVTGQVERIVFSVLRWTSGRLQRREMDRPLPADLVLDLSTPRILLLGARVFPEPERLGVALGGPAVRLRRRAHPSFDYDELPASPPERAVLALCARVTTLEAVLRLPHPRPHLLRAAYGLVAGGMVEAKGGAREVEAPPMVPVPAKEPAIDLRDVASPPPVGDDIVIETDEASVPLDAETGEQIARELLEKGEHERAVAHLTEVVAQHPEAVGSRRLLAIARANDLGRDPAVEQLFLEVLEARPQDNELRYRLAKHYRRAGLRARALLQLRLVLSSDPGHAAAWKDLGELEAGEGRGVR